MTTYRHQVYVQLVHVQRYFTNTLSRIRVEEYLMLTTYFTDLLERLYNANLVVHMDKGTHQGIWSNGLLKFFYVNEAIRTNWHICHIKAFIFKVAARVKHALVLNLRGNNVLLLVSVERGSTL